MVKQILEDTFEKIAEHGGKAIKQSVKQVKQTVSPTKMWEELLGVSSSESFDNKGKERTEVKSGGKHTPLDFEKLGKNYQEKEFQQTEALKQRLFQLVKGGEEKAIMEGKKEEEERKRKEFMEEQQKKKKQEEKRKQEQAVEMPKGKVRRSIFSPKKVAEREHAEFKPSSGKQ